jgi:hypothetical protein
MTDKHTRKGVPRLKVDTHMGGNIGFGLPSVLGFLGDEFEKGSFFIYLQFTVTVAFCLDFHSYINFLGS